MKKLLKEQKIEILGIIVILFVISIVSIFSINTRRKEEMKINNYKGGKSESILGQEYLEENKEQKNIDLGNNTKHYLKSCDGSQSSATNFLGIEGEERGEILRIVFNPDDTVSIPSTTYDVSETGDGSIICWVSNHIAYIKTIDGSKIYANPDSSYLFAGLGHGYGSSNRIDSDYYDNEGIIVNLDQLDTSEVTNMSYMFYDMGSSGTGGSVGTISYLDLGENFDTSSVTDMSYMFSNCGDHLESFNIGSKFDTSNVINMEGMFQRFGCTTGWGDIGTLDLGDKFNTSKVTNMKSMFKNLGTFSYLDLGEKFDTSSVTDMSYMFYANSTWGYGSQGTLVKIDLGDKFDTSKVTDMSYMFYWRLVAGYTGSPNLVELDLGPAFKSIASNHADMFSGVFKEENTPVIYCSADIIKDEHTLKLNSTSSTTINVSPATVKRGQYDNDIYIVSKTTVSNPQVGDIDGDGYVTALDARVGSFYQVNLIDIGTQLQIGSKTLTITEDVIDRMDMDGDGSIDGSDLTDIARYYNSTYQNLLSSAEEFELVEITDDNEILTIDNSNITWEILNEQGSATISDDGVITPTGEGNISLQANFNDEQVKLLLKIINNKYEEIKLYDGPEWVSTAKELPKNESDARWKQEGVTVYLRNASLEKEYEYTTSDGMEWFDCTLGSNRGDDWYEIRLEEEGEYEIKVRSKDLTEISETYYVKIDGTAPEITKFEIESTANTITVKGEATDNLSGVKTYKYELSLASQTEVLDEYEGINGEYTFEGLQSNTFYYIKNVIIEDEAGNQVINKYPRPSGDIYTKPYAPKVSNLSNGESLLNEDEKNIYKGVDENGVLILYFVDTENDNKEGITYSYKVDNGEYATKQDMIYIDREEGTHTLYVKAEGTGGESEERTYTIRIIPDDRYIVTFDAQGGSLGEGVENIKEVTNNSPYGELPTPTKEGYKFTGWYTEKTGGEEITKDSIVNLHEDITLYAIWKEEIKLYDGPEWVSTAKELPKNESDAQWKQEGVTVYLRNASLEKEYEYTTSDGMEWFDCTLRSDKGDDWYEIRLEEEGEYEIKVQSKDLTEISETYYVKVDKTKPTITKFEIEPNSTSRSITIKMNAVDYLSGYAGYTYKLYEAGEGQNTLIATAEDYLEEYTFEGLSLNTMYYIDVEVYDVAGNKSTNKDLPIDDLSVVIKTEDPTPEVPVTGISVSPTTLNLEVGETKTLSAIVTPSNADNKNITWSSSEETVATVKNGLVTAVGKGEAIITVTTEDGEYIATCKVTVTDNKSEVEPENPNENDNLNNNGGNNNNNNNNGTNNVGTSTSGQKNDPTTATGTLPDTGKSVLIIAIGTGLLSYAVVMIIKYKKM